MYKIGDLVRNGHFIGYITELHPDYIGKYRVQYITPNIQVFASGKLMSPLNARKNQNILNLYRNKK